MPKRARGFSLLEVLVAFVILALVLGTLMEIFSGALRNASNASDYQHAVLLAQSKLATVGIETALTEGDSDGEFDSTYRWHLTIKPYQDIPSGPVDVPGAEPGAPPLQMIPVIPVRLMEVEVRVSWNAGNQPKTVALNTVRLANKVAL